MSGELNLELSWAGPYSWPKFEAKNGLPELPAHSGVYLQTAEYESGYLIYSAGITGWPFRKRFSEHTRFFLNGDYTVLDIAMLQRGWRHEIWHGWGCARSHRAEFVERESEIRGAAKRQMAGFRLFVAQVDNKRVRERLETAIMHCLYLVPSALCLIPDRGMRLWPRRPSEVPITVSNACSSQLYGLPDQLSI